MSEPKLIPKCRGYYRNCKNEATIQLANGEWYCNECYQEGLHDEEVAMGLYDKDYIRKLNQPCKVESKEGVEE